MISDTVALLEEISIGTWERIKFAYLANLKISETTLTENLLFKINRSGATGNSCIRIYESKSEETNGNDLEIFVEIDKDKYIFLAAQAKKLYVKDQKYTTISHKVNGVYQIDLLNEYAKSKNGLALYLLYNYSLSADFKDKARFGCTLIRSDHIKENFYPKDTKYWEIPTFDDLNKINSKYSLCSAIPLQRIFNYCQNIVDTDKSLRLMRKVDILQEVDEWDPIDEDPVIIHEYPDGKYDDNAKINRDEPSYRGKSQFCPRYRIIIPFKRLV